MVLLQKERREGVNPPAFVVMPDAFSQACA